MKIVEIDISELPAPEPMQVILSSLAELSNESALKVKHRREPFPLYERLLANGWLYHSDKIAEEHVVIHIAHARCKQEFIDFITQGK